MKGVNNPRHTVTLAVGSVTNAMRGQTLLRQNGISATVGRVPADDQNGCGYTLTLRGEEERARRILHAAGIRVRPLP